MPVTHKETPRVIMLNGIDGPPPGASPRRGTQQLRWVAAVILSIFLPTAWLARLLQTSPPGKGHP
jgi:hypothetical protein